MADRGRRALLRGDRRQRGRRGRAERDERGLSRGVHARHRRVAARCARGCGAGLDRGGRRGRGQPGARPGARVLRRPAGRRGAGLREPTQ